MQDGRLILLILIVIAVVLVILWVMRRSSSQREAQRVEAADLRGRAEEIAATMGGQQAFAQQAEERAAVARTEAEQRAKEAARLEAEAAEQRAAAEATQREYETQMRRADDVDPDVKESRFAPVPAQERADDAHAAPAGDADATVAAAPAGDDADAAPADAPAAERAEGEPEAPMTRAERRAAREQAESQGSGSALAAPVVAASGAAVAGASTWGDRREDREPDSERIASAADYRDDVTPEDGSRREEAAAEVSPTAATGTGPGMSENSRETDPANDLSQDANDVAQDSESPRGEWGGPRSDDADDTTRRTAGEASSEDIAVDDAARDATPADATSPDADNDATGRTAIIGDIEEYASTEPLTRDEQTPPIEPDEPDAERGDAERGDATSDRDTATGDEGESRADTEDRPATPTNDWAADEGELLEQNRERGEALGQDRTELSSGEDTAPRDTGDATSAADTTTSASGASAPTAAADPQERAAQAGTGTEDLPGPTDEGPGERAARRVSGFDELRDGGYGVGSAAALDDGAQPLDHPIQGFRDSMTMRVPGDPGYDEGEPDVWFYDEEAAERSGFRRSQD